MALGFRSVRDCQEHINSSEFAEWLAYNQLEPFGADIQPVYAGTIAATVANTTRSKSSDKIFKWSDFFPTLDSAEQHQSIEDQIAIVELLNEAFGGKDLRGEKNPPTA